MNSLNYAFPKYYLFLHINLCFKGNGFNFEKVFFFMILVIRGILIQWFLERRDTFELKLNILSLS